MRSPRQSGIACLKVFSMSCNTLFQISSISNSSKRFAGPGFIFPGHSRNNKWENFSAKSTKLRGSCCWSVGGEIKFGLHLVSAEMEDRRKTADSQQQSLDKVDRLLISWVTNHLGFSSCLPSVFCIPPTWALRAAAVIRDFINGFYQNIPSYPRDGLGSAELIIFKCNVAIFASEL